MFLYVEVEISCSEVKISNLLFRLFGRCTHKSNAVFHISKIIAKNTQRKKQVYILQYELLKNIIVFCNATH
jgi:hypothetical protein